MQYLNLNLRSFKREYMKVIINCFESHPENITQNKDIEFISCKENECDLFIMLDILDLEDPIDIRCPDGGFWCISYEPPVECYKYFTDSYKYFDLINTHWENLPEDIEHKVIRDRYPIWQLSGLSMSEIAALKQSDCINKVDQVSAVISSASNLPGHKLRSQFIDYLKEQDFDFDHYGAGINWIPNKYDALLPYKYSIGIENSQSPFYCTEKIGDCYACLTMPIYWGCPNIAEYFPEESMILIDENDFSGSLETIKEAIRNDYYTKNFDAIVHARDLLVNELSLYPYICRMIEKYYKPTSKPKQHYFPGRLSPKQKKLSYKIKKAFGVYKVKDRIRKRKLKATVQ